jgi:hypothetical protein
LGICEHPCGVGCQQASSFTAIGNVGTLYCWSQGISCMVWAPYTFSDYTLGLRSGWIRIEGALERSHAVWGVAAKRGRCGVVQIHQQALRRRDYEVGYGDFPGTTYGKDKPGLLGWRSS